MIKHNDTMSPKGNTAALLHHRGPLEHTPEPVNVHAITQPIQSNPGSGRLETVHHQHHLQV